jgi:hypothetical protein
MGLAGRRWSLAGCASERHTRDQPSCDPYGVPFCDTINMEWAGGRPFDCGLLVALAAPLTRVVRHSILH